VNFSYWQFVKLWGRILPESLKLMTALVVLLK
jgi:hypothetical protein